MKYQIILNFISRVGILFYLLLTALSSLLYLVEDDYSLIIFDEFAMYLHTVFVISIITSIFIYKTNSRYTISLIVISLSSFFFIMCICQTLGMQSPKFGAVQVAGYNLISNIIIIGSIIKSRKNLQIA